MAWILLFIAGLLEVVWAIGMKQSHGFTKLWPSVWTIVAMLASFTCLALAMRTLPLSVSYTVWVGIGAVGSVIAGVILFSERLNHVQYACVAMVGVGILGLKVTGSAPAKAALVAPANPLEALPRAGTSPTGDEGERSDP